MKETKLRLIEFILNEASEEQIEGLEQLLIQNDINYGLEGILGGRDFDNYLKTQARDIYYEDINHALAELSNGNIKDAEKILQEALKK